MAYDKPSWREIDRQRDGSGKKRSKKKDNSGVPQHSTRYDRYKADLNRLFDQGLAGELLKKQGKEAEQSESTEAAEDSSSSKDGGQAKGESQGKPNNKVKTSKVKSSKDTPSSKTAAVRRKSGGRASSSVAKSGSRFKLIRAVIDAQEHSEVIEAISKLVEDFGLPNDWEVLVRVMEHPREELVLDAIDKMDQLLASQAKVTRRASLKERLRTISQTASDQELRLKAQELEEKL